MIFKPASRYPADPRAVFILALSVFSGATTLAVGVGSDNLDAVLPYWAVMLWSALLMIGSAITLVGMLYHTVNGIIVEQIGSITVAMTAIFYSGVALRETGTEELGSVGIILAWGIACIFRWGQLQSLLVSAYRRQKKQEAIRILHAAIEARAAKELARRKSSPGRPL